MLDKNFRVGNLVTIGTLQVITVVAPCAKAIRSTYVSLPNLGPETVDLVINENILGVAAVAWDLPLENGTLFGSQDGPYPRRDILIDRH